MCPLFEIVFTPTFTSTCANVFVIIFLSDDETDGVREEGNTPQKFSKFISKVFQARIVDIIENYKTTDLNNPVEILKYMEIRLVQGRPLDIEDVTQCISGATNFIMVDRSDLMNAVLKEIQHVSFVTLEMQFYNEVMIMVFNP